MHTEPITRSRTPENAGIFHPAPLATLPSDSEAHFELYLAIPVRTGVRYMLYKSKEIELTRQKRLELIEKGVSTLFVRETDVETYHSFVERTVGKMLTSDTTPPQKKSEILYATTSAMVRSTFQRPDSSALITTNQKLMGHQVALLASEPKMVRTMTTLFALDYSLYTHSVHVSVLGTGLLLETGHKNESQMREISMGFLLHDIGKSRVPAHILRKPGMLSVSEVKQVEKHPEYGVELMQHHEKIEPVSIDIIHNHHEKMNGSGYPRRMPGQKISLVTRICSVVDIFDALTSHRPYKPAMTGFQAMSFIIERMSHELDPELLQILASMLGPSHARSINW